MAIPPNSTGSRCNNNDAPHLQENVDEDGAGLFLGPPAMEEDPTADVRRRMRILEQVMQDPHLFEVQPGIWEIRPADYNPNEGTFDNPIDIENQDPNERSGLFEPSAESMRNRMIDRVVNAAGDAILGGGVLSYGATFTVNEHNGINGRESPVSVASDGTVRRIMEEIAHEEGQIRAMEDEILRQQEEERMAEEARVMDDIEEQLEEEDEAPELAEEESEVSNFAERRDGEVNAFFADFVPLIVSGPYTDVMIGNAPFFNALLAEGGGIDRAIAEMIAIQERVIIQAEAVRVALLMLRGRIIIRRMEAHQKERAEERAERKNNNKK